MPEGGYEPTVSTNFVSPSTLKELAPGDKLIDLTEKNYRGEAIVQKLGENTYWFQTSFYNTSFYVGKKSVLLMDPLGYGAGVKLLKAIKSITNKPVSTVIYSHHHEDHIGDITIFVKEATKNNQTLRIVATSETASAMKRNHSKLPKPSYIIKRGRRSFKFENKTIKVIRYKKAAHSLDSAAWLLVEEKLIHSPDIVNANQVPFQGFGGSLTFTGYRENLMQLKNEDWLYFSSGHGNIGSKQDIDFMIKYVDTLVRLTKEAQNKTSLKDYFVSKYNNHHASFHAYNLALEEYVISKMRKIYGNMYGFETSVPYQIKMVLESFH